jgi:SET domain-containing protein
MSISSETQAAYHPSHEPALAAQDSMNPKYQKFDVLVKPSPIDGLGVFAAVVIPRRLKIGEIRGESLGVQEARIRATRYERIMMVEVSPRRAIDFSKSTDPMRYTNHSCVPNARLCIRQRRVEFYALRDIAPGEEITIHYGQSHHEGRLACRCGAAGCAGSL